MHPAARSTVDAFAEVHESVPRRRPALRALPLAHDFRSRLDQAGVVVDGPLVAAGLVVDLASYRVCLDGAERSLTPRQVELLAVLVAAPDRVWSREQLQWLCWGDTASSRRVDVQLCRVRTQLGVDVFRNVRDRGWSLGLAARG